MRRNEVAVPYEHVLETLVHETERDVLAALKPHFVAMHDGSVFQASFRTAQERDTARQVIGQQRSPRVAADR